MTEADKIRKWLYTEVLLSFIDNKHYIIKQKIKYTVSFIQVNDPDGAELCFDVSLETSNRPITPTSKLIFRFHNIILFL